MTKKEWLSRARDMDLEIKALERTKQSLYDKATNIVPSNSGMNVQGGGSDPHKSESYAIYSAELDEMVKRLKDVKMEILREINTLPDTDSILRTILIMRYVQCVPTWEQIALDIGYSYRDTTRKHGEALMKLQIPSL